MDVGKVRRHRRFVLIKKIFQALIELDQIFAAEQGEDLTYTQALRRLAKRQQGVLDLFEARRGKSVRDEFEGIVHEVLRALRPH